MPDLISNSNDGDVALLTFESIPQDCLKGLTEGYKVAMAISDGLGTCL